MCFISLVLFRVRFCRPPNPELSRRPVGGCPIGVGRVSLRPHRQLRGRLNDMLHRSRNCFRPKMLLPHQSSRFPTFKEVVSTSRGSPSTGFALKYWIQQHALTMERVTLPPEQLLNQRLVGGKEMPAWPFSGSAILPFFSQARAGFWGYSFQIRW
jgi:hypothetical protein